MESQTLRFRVLGEWAAIKTLPYIFFSFYRFKKHALYHTYSSCCFSFHFSHPTGAVSMPSNGAISHLRAVLY